MARDIRTYLGLLKHSDTHEVSQNHACLPFESYAHMSW